MNKNLRRIYLNGISVEMLEQMPDGSIKVQVRFDDVDVHNNARWCADEIQLDPVVTATGYSLNITSGNTLTLDQGRTATRRTNPITLADGAKVFADPTLMRCVDGTWLNMEANSGLVVDNNSTLRLEPGSRLDLADGAVLRVKRGGKLEVMENSTLTIAPGGHVIIEEDVDEGNDGRLIYHPDARINLDGTTSELEISGVLEIKENAVFRIASSANPTLTKGRLRFSNTDPTSQNITAEDNTRFIVTSDHIGRRVLYVDQESLYGPDQLVEFSLRTSTAVLVDGARIVPPLSNTCSISIDHARVTSPNTQRNAHRGVRMNGQDNVSISNSIFQNGKWGLYSYNSTLDGSISVTDCDFLNCDVGMHVYDNGLDLSNCVFGSNGTGLNAEGMTHSSELNMCRAIGNATGVFFQGATGLRIHDPEFDQNDDGLIVHQADVSIACGSISHNTNRGIMVAYGAALHMDGSAGTLHEPVTVVENAYSIRCKKALNCYLDYGYNSLRPATPGIQRSLSGTFLCQLYFGQRARYNEWNGTATPPLTTADYQILTDCAVNVPFVDAYSAPEVPCGQAVPPCPDPPCQGHWDEFTYCPSCEVIVTDEFGSVRLNIASMEAKALAETATPDNEKVALAGYNEILMADLTNINSQENWLLTYDYAKMRESLGDALAKGQLSLADANEEADVYDDLMSEVQNKKIDAALSGGNYDLRLYTTLDRVGALRGFGKLDEAMALMEEVATWVEEEEMDLINRLLCLVQVESAVVAGTIPWYEVEDATAHCSNGGERSAHFFGTGNDQLAMEIRLQPNPASDIVWVTGLPEKSYELRLLDASGRITLRKTFSGNTELVIDHLDRGVYTCQVYGALGERHFQRLILGR